MSYDEQNSVPAALQKQMDALQAPAEETGTPVPDATPAPEAQPQPETPPPAEQQTPAPEETPKPTDEAPQPSPQSEAASKLADPLAKR